MSQLENIIDPIKIISSCCSYKSAHLEKDFLHIISKLYQYEIFKPYLDFVSTLCHQKCLRFEIEEKAIYHFDEGNCKTFTTIIDAFGNSKKNYVISIKKIMPDVLIHEITHMLENELSIDLESGFASALKTDLSIQSNFTTTLTAVVRTVMIKEVAGYPKDQVNSELFARILQLFAMSKETMGKMATYGYSISDMYKAFRNTNRWIHIHLFRLLYPKIDPQIARASMRLQKPINEIVHNWAQDAIKSFHKDKAPPSRKWGSAIKSIKD